MISPTWLLALLLLGQYPLNRDALKIVSIVTFDSLNTSMRLSSITRKSERELASL